MISELRSQNTLDVPYATALRAKHYAFEYIYGDQTTSFSRLPSYLHALEKTNPGSFTAMEIDYSDNNKFLNAFFALGASIQGFLRYGRPVIVIDGSHLKEKYNGILFVAVTQDGDREVFPLATGIGHIEDDMTWIWFLEQLRNVYGSPTDLVIVSDAHVSITNVVKTVFPDAHHCLCYFHILKNISTAGGVVKSLFHQSSYAYTTEECDIALGTIRTINDDVFRKLRRVGQKKWARSYCPVRMYEFLTSNAAETFNNRVLWARTLPITAGLEAVRAVIEQWFSRRRTSANAREHPVASKVEKKLDKAMREGATCSVSLLNDMTFKVRDNQKIRVVDLGNMSCSYKKFDLRLIPCRHAAAAVRFINHDIFAYVDDRYKTSHLRGMWSYLVMPIPDPTKWTVPTIVQEMICLPPNRQRQVGRPRKHIYSVGESSSRSTSQHCSRCGAVGHKVATCNAYFDPWQAQTNICNDAEGSRKRAPRKCKLCKSTEHTRKKCPNYGNDN